MLRMHFHSIELGALLDGKSMRLVLLPTHPRRRATKPLIEISHGAFQQAPRASDGAVEPRLANPWRPSGMCVQSARHVPAIRGRAVTPSHREEREALLSPRQGGGTETWQILCADSMPERRNVGCRLESCRHIHWQRTEEMCQMRTIRQRRLRSGRLHPHLWSSSRP